MLYAGRWAAGFACALACCFGSDQSRAAETYFEFKTLGAWVARGYTDYRVEPSDGWSFHPQVALSEVEFYITNDSPEAPMVFDYWYLSFSAPSDEDLAVGVYDDARRFNNVAIPGLQMTSTGVGNNQVSGSFEVFELAYAADGSVSRFSADFTMFEEMEPNHRIDGSIRFNAIGAEAVPEPSSLALAGIGVVVAAVAGRRSPRHPRTTENAG